MSDEALRTYRLPILASTCYFLMYYGFIIHQVRMKKRYLGMEDALLAKERLNKESGKPHPQHNADRGVGNTLEQMGPFIVGLWMYAAFVDADTAGWLGLAYVATRSLYVYLFWPPKWRVLFSTLPNYLIIAFFLFGTAGKALSA